MTGVEITLFAKDGGPLSKRIELRPDGTVKSDGSECRMARGEAKRVTFDTMEVCARLISSMAPNEALALGCLRPGVGQRAAVVTKSKLNGDASHVIARTANDIVFKKGKPALALLDFDTKGMPQTVAERLKESGGFWPALISIVPELDAAGRITRYSTSSGLYRADTGAELTGSKGIHLYVLVKDGADIVRFLADLHARCWLAGLGWYMLGAGGQLLERSIVDRMVGQPERLVFEGGPILVPPVKQNRETRRPVAVEGQVLDTITAVPPLSVVEKAAVDKLKAEQRQQLAPAVAEARGEYIAHRAKQLSERIGMPLHDARHVIERQCAGVLHPDIVLCFDDDEFAGCTVADVLADPKRFEGATLADPLEGVEYGIGKAKIMRRADGSPWIHSFAHGRVIYELKYDAKAVRAALEKTDRHHMVETIIRMALLGDLSEDETDALRDEVAIKTGAKTSTVKRMLKAAFQKQCMERKAEERERQLAERTDPRPMIAAPEPDAPWIPIAKMINGVASPDRNQRPAYRDIDYDCSKARRFNEPPDRAFLTANEPEEP